MRGRNVIFICAFLVLSSLAWAKEDRVLTIQLGEKKAGGVLLLTPFTTGENYVVELRSAVTANNIVSNLYFGYQDRTSFYVFSFNNSDHAFRLALSNGQLGSYGRPSNTLREVFFRDYRKNHPGFSVGGVFHILRVEVDGKRIRCFVDGEVLFDVEDETMTKDGRVGFDVGGFRVKEKPYGLYVKKFAVQSKGGKGKAISFSDDFTTVPDEQRYEIGESGRYRDGRFDMLRLVPCPPDVVSLLPSDVGIQYQGLGKTGFGIPGYGFAVVGDFAYIAPGEGELQVVDLSEKKNPQVTHYFGMNFLGGTVKYSESFLYLPTRGGLRALDIRDPASPKAHYDLGYRPSEGGVVRGGFFFEKAGRKYFAGCNPYSDTWLYILDCTDPLKPKEVGMLTTPDIRSWGGFYLPKSQKGCFLVPRKSPPGSRWVTVDLREPSSPKLVQDGLLEDYERIYPLPGTDTFAGIKKVGKLARLSILMGESAEELREVGSKNLGLGIVRGMSLYRDKYLYLSLAGSVGTQDSVCRTEPDTYLPVVDVREPEKPKKLTKIKADTISRYTSLLAQDGYLYVQDYNYGMWIYDISDPENPKKISGVPEAGEGHFAWAGGNYAFLSQTFGSGGFLFDVSDPSNPKKLSFLWNQEWILNRPAGKDGAVYFPSQYGVSVWDISAPGAPEKKGEFPLPAEANGQKVHGPKILVDDNRAYVSVGIVEKWGYAPLHLLTYDISNVLEPRLLSDLNLSSNAIHFTPHLRKSGSFLYLNWLSREKDYFLVIDVAESAKPRVVKKFDLNDAGIELSKAFNMPYPGRFAVSGGYAYLLASQEGLQGDKPYLYVLDVSDPEKISLANKMIWGTGSNFLDIGIFGPYLYLNNYYGPIYVFDLKNPREPRSLTFFSTGSNQWALGAYQDGYLYVPCLDAMRIYKLPQK